MEAFPRNPYFGSTTDLCVGISERRGTTFTLTAATVTIKNKTTGTATRTAAVCTRDNTNLEAYYTETFSAANGYAEGTTYVATFLLTTSDGHIEVVEGEFMVQARNDI